MISTIWNEFGNPAQRDNIFPGCTLDPDYKKLREWREENFPKTEDTLLSFDYHRLQIEYWLWLQKDRIISPVVDIGTPPIRSWVKREYIRFGQTDENDVKGDLLNLPFEDESIGTIFCTEVLEHVTDPFRAVREMHRVLRPEGSLLITSPFLWPWHGTDQYNDYWRFTHQGWRLLLAPFSEVKVLECCMTEEGAWLYDILRRFEGLGWRASTRISTGYLCSGVKRKEGDD